MTLRVRILLFLLLFGLLPLLLVVMINLPLVLERVDLFYRAAFLQNLRADFSDLDQHLASRDASVRLLARLPEPGALVGGVAGQEQDEIDVARARYTQWINRILGDELDITEIRFLDGSGVERFWLERSPETGQWEPTARTLPDLPREQIALMLSGRMNNVVLSPLRIDVEANDPARVFTLQLLGPIQPLTSSEAPIGVVAITLDIAGLVRRDRDTLWVHGDGRYLALPNLATRPGNAFDDFPGLEEDFRANRVILWESGSDRVIWVPMFRTLGGGTLWVGRPVDGTPLEAFRTEIIFRVLLIVLLLIAIQFFVARWITRRAERIGEELTNGVQQTLESDTPAVFDWSGSPELRQLAADLTRLSRNHASQTRNLRAHAQELEATNKYKSEFLANVSHELRTPLNSILLLSKLLAVKSEDMPADLREQAGVIHKASSDLKALIDNILDLSRIEAGRLQLTVEPMSIKALFEDVRVLLEPQFKDKGLHLAVDIESRVPDLIETDVDKVAQVMKNFLANALKFTDSGAVRLKAGLAGPPYAVRLAVEDGGIGIPESKHEAIFDAFKQADGSTSRRYGGTGLGLTISRQLAQLLGGEIRLSSEPGRGSEFSLLLPRACPEHEADTEEAPFTKLPGPVEEAEPVPQDLRGLDVLLMEPDIRQQLHLTGVLRTFGLSLHLADDLEEALETLDELKHVDYLLIEALMPDDGACATIEKIRENLGDEMVVISLFPSGQDVDELACQQQGADDFVVLPCDPHELYEVLARHSRSH